MRFFFVIAVALILGCGEESNLKRPPSSLGATGAGGAGAGAGGDASASSGSGNGSGGGAGGQSDLDGGAGGPTEAGSSDPPCTNDYAYGAIGMAFTWPTPQALGLALSELAYDPASRPISIVLSAKGGVASATMSASATTDNGMGSQIFPPAMKPPFVPATLSFGGFETGAPQATAHLRFIDKAGPVDIEINGVNVKVTTSASCSNMVATLNATIPVSEGGKTLHLNGGDSTIAELGGGSGGGPKDAGKEAWEIRAYFSGETMSFDFTTLK